MDLDLQRGEVALGLGLDRLVLRCRCPGKPHPPRPRFPFHSFDASPFRARSAWLSRRLRLWRRFRRGGCETVSAPARGVRLRGGGRRNVGRPGSGDAFQHGRQDLSGHGTEFPALRNAHRIIARLSLEGGGRNVEVVLNRCDLPHSDIGEEQARKALGRPVRWKVPNASEVVQKAWDRGVPVAMGKSPITNALMEMAREACGKPPRRRRPADPQLFRFQNGGAVGRRLNVTQTGLWFTG